MAESTHTPGPWTYGPAYNYVGFYVAPQGTLPTLAAVERPRGTQELTNVTCFNFPGSTEANARLIAAAPALLEACKALCAWDKKYPKGVIYPAGPNDVDKQLDAIVEHANAAITAATAPGEGM